MCGPVLWSGGWEVCGPPSLPLAFIVKNARAVGRRVTPPSARPLQLVAAPLCVGWYVSFCVVREEGSLSCHAFFFHFVFFVHLVFRGHVSSSVGVMTSE